MKISVNGKELKVDSVSNNINLNNKTRKSRSVSISISDPSISVDTVAEFFSDNYNGTLTAITDNGNTVTYEGYPAVSISHFVDDEKLRFNVVCEPEPIIEE